MINILKLTLLIILISPAMSDDYRPSLLVNSEVNVASENPKLGEIAKIDGRFDEFEKLIADLKDVSLNMNLRPLETKTISGNTVLENIERTGIPLDSFGYSVPMEIKIVRNGRSISREDVLKAAMNHVHSQAELEINVKSVEWEKDQVLPIGEATFSIQILGSPDKGKMPIKVIAHQKEQISASFLATALVDDWKSIPVVRGRLDRGSVISPNDIHIIKANLSSLPIDVAVATDEITGKRLTRTIPAGEPIRLSDLDIPPIIERGKLVKMIYKSGGFSATASGIAMEPGFSDQVIELRNERSNKIVKGKVINADEVLMLK